MTGRLFVLAWRVVPHLPGPLTRGLFDAVALALSIVRPSGVRQLERNLARLRPEASPAQVRRLARTATRGYMRYFGETFAMPGWSPEQFDARVRTIGAQAIRDELAAGRSAVLAVAHTGNWDLAGAWAARNLGPVATVVEKLEPESVFREFVALREANGVTIIPFERGTGVFRKLLAQVKAGGRVVPLVADRDLTRGGVPVALAGHRARVGAGPAALAVATKSPVFATHIRYERLRGRRRRAAGSPWGIVLEFAPPLPVPDLADREEAVARLTQEWVDVIADRLVRYPESWHMLQKVFVADLDADRLRRAVGAGAA